MEKISLKSVCLSYTARDMRVDVFRGFDASIDEGDFVLVLGKSGAGKSSLLNIIAGLTTPTSGSVLVDGVDMTTLTRRQKAAFRNKRIGYVFQHFNLVDSLNALENVMAPLLIAGEKLGNAKKKGRALLDRVGLLDREKHFAYQLSGGEQQRVAIARALANDPDIILADEPTGNLDAKTAAGVLDLIDELHAAGKTVVMVSHDESISERATRVLRMEDLAG